MSPVRDAVVAPESREISYLAAVSLALDRVDEAYSVARRLVFDQVPAGTDPRSVPLSAAQRGALDRLDAAESEMVEVRERRHTPVR